MNSLSIILFILFPLACSLIIIFVQKCKKSYSISFSRDSFIFLILMFSFFFSVFFGMRYDVGVDFLHYVRIYEDPINEYNSFKSFEPFFKILFFVLQKLKLSYEFVFIITCFFQMYFFLYAFKDYKQYLVFEIIILFLLMIFYYLNIIRQCTAYSIMLCAYVLLANNKRKQFLLVALLACLFHKSAYLGLICIFFTYKKNTIFDNCIAQILIILVSMVIGQKYAVTILEILIQRITTPVMSRLISRAINDQMANASGIGVFLKQLTYMFIIWLLRSNNKSDIVFYKRIFLIGVVTLNIFTYSIILSRFCWYFLIVIFFLLGEICWDFTEHWKQKSDYEKVSFIFLIAIYVLLYFVSLFTNSNQHCIPFNYDFSIK